MTDNASLPPAAGDGVTDDTAAIQAGAAIRHGASLPQADVQRPKDRFLDASRAEVGLLAKEVVIERSAANTLRMRNGELRAEVELLREQVERLQQHHAEMNDPLA